MRILTWGIFLVISTMYAGENEKNELVLNIQEKEVALSDKEKKITCLFVTHNTKYSKLGNKQYSLQQGKINILN